MEEQASNNPAKNLDPASAMTFQQLVAENERLRAELAGVARANVLAAELMAELEETNEELASTTAELQKEISHRQLMEQMMFQSRSMLNNILNSSLDGVFVFQAVRNGDGLIKDFEFLIANPAALKLFGGQAPLVGKRLLETFPESREQTLFEAYVQLVESGQALKKVLSFSQNGIQSRFHVVGVKLGDGLSVTFRNISEIWSECAEEKQAQPEAVRH